MASYQIGRSVNESLPDGSVWASKKASLRAYMIPRSTAYSRLSPSWLSSLQHIPYCMDAGRTWFNSQTGSQLDSYHRLWDPWNCPLAFKTALLQRDIVRVWVSTFSITIHFICLHYIYLWISLCMIVWPRTTTCIFDNPCPQKDKPSGPWYYRFSLPPSIRSCWPVHSRAFTWAFMEMKTSNKSKFASELHEKEVWQLAHACFLCFIDVIT